jgi:crotonobetainyl-CoA:carnitine CoA-transferase CaiB-like acyl-CoA transferase
MKRIAICIVIGLFVATSAYSQGNYFYEITIVGKRHSPLSGVKVWLKEKNSGEWIEILNNGGIACGPILNIKEVFENEQVLHLKMLEEMDHPLCGKIKTIGIPTKLSRTPGTVRTPPPLKGEHTDEVLKELGFSEAIIAAYHENKIV